MAYGRRLLMDVNKFTDKAVEVFRACSLVPTAVAARISAAGREGTYEVEAKWSQRDIERGKKLAYSKSYFVERKGTTLESLYATTFQNDATKVVKEAYASGCCVKAALVKDKQAKAEESAKPQQYIEVWNGSVLLKTIAVEDLKKHGDINEDTSFGSFQLSADGKQLLYIAEKEKPKAISYFKKQPPKKEDTPTIKGAEYVYESSWGEQLSKVVHPVPVVLTLDTEECVVIDTAKFGDISAGQARWVPGEEGGVVFAGWENRPIKLGFIYCLNRRSALYYVNIKTEEYTKLTDNDHCVFSPRFNPQVNKMVYFKAVAGGPHHTCAALMMMEWPSRTISTVIDIVKRPKTPEDFPGFYALLLPERCWNNSGDRVIFSDNWGSYVEVNCVDVTEKRVTKISGAERKGAWLVLDVSHDLVVAQFSDVTTPPQLFIGALPDNPADSVAWTQIAATHTALTAGMKWDVTTYQTDDGLYYQTILLSPPPSTDTSLPPPLAVIPHGGPHSVVPADFLVWPTCLAALGFAVLMVNYRGSSGFGQDNIYSLPGKAGAQDVLDVQKAAEAVIEKGLADKDRVVVRGGSHGGFLTCHLVAQFPDFYKAGVAHNPVTDISSQAATSDIPDWCFLEGGVQHEYDPAKPRSADEVSAMLNTSPLTLADKIKVPILFLLGSEDLRVPPQQGYLLYNTLKAQNKETKVLLYPGECHPINSVYCEADSFINTAVWMYRYACSQEK